MIKKSSLYILFLLACGSPALAQSNGSSPYSSFGLGLIKGPELPQNRAMGGIGAGLSGLGSYNNINLANPASYADMRMTTFDIGLSTSLTSLSRTGVSQPAIFNASFSHISFGIPVTKHSALSFGLSPYSDLGYKYQQTTKVDTSTVNYIYSGEGGLAKAHLGYGFYIGKHLKAGFNLAYIFGKLDQSAGAEFNSIAYRNSRSTQSNAIGGMNYDYGLQYSTAVGSKTRFSAGYSGSTGNQLRLTSTRLNLLYFLQYNYDEQKYEENGLYDTVSTSVVKSKVQLPTMQRAGFTFDRAEKWLFGVDIAFANWSSYRSAGSNPGLQNSFAVHAGGQITPDIRAVSNYFKLVDYRAGFKYEKTYMRLKNTDIKDAALTLGLGLPLPSNRGVSFYKVNFTTELGQRGSLNNGLVRERYANFYVGVTLNDLWFQKFKFD